MRAFLPLMAMFLAACAQVTRGPLPERQSRQAGEFTIEYSPGDEAYADLLAGKLAERRLPAVTVQPLPLGVEELHRDRERLLQRVGWFLGLEAPTPEMGKTFDGFVGLYGEILGQFQARRRFALWQRDEVIARLKAKQNIPGFALDARNELTFTFAVKVEHTTDEKTGETKTTQEGARDVAWPIKIRQRDGRTPEQELAEGLEMEEGVGPALANQMTAALTFLVLHEATETTVVTTFISSADRRWFCDGVANYVALRVLAGEVGVEAAKKYYDLDEQLRSHAALAHRINLEKWPAGEDMAKAKYAEDVNTADYAFATKVIADICAKHGDEILPKLFREIGKTQKENVTMKTVYAAFRKLTGEDMRIYLRKPVLPRAGVGT